MFLDYILLFLLSLFPNTCFSQRCFCPLLDNDHSLWNALFVSSILLTIFLNALLQPCHLLPPELALCAQTLRTSCVSALKICMTPQGTQSEAYISSVVFRVPKMFWSSQSRLVLLHRLLSLALLKCFLTWYPSSPTSALEGLTWTSASPIRLAGFLGLPWTEMISYPQKTSVFLMIKDGSHLSHSNHLCKYSVITTVSS